MMGYNALQTPKNETINDGFNLNFPANNEMSRTNSQNGFHQHQSNNLYLENQNVDYKNVKLDPEIIKKEALQSRENFMYYYTAFNTQRNFQNKKINQNSKIDLWTLYKAVVELGGSPTVI